MCVYVCRGFCLLYGPMPKEGAGAWQISLYVGSHTRSFTLFLYMYPSHHHKAEMELSLMSWNWRTHEANQVRFYPSLVYV